jgi:Na+/H+ antiporter NhaD/arsenite permease-like protein
MGLDIRWPIGLMFSLIGAMLTLFGLVTHSKSEMYEGSLGININLIWGVVLLAFGVFMLVMAIRGTKEKNHPPS